MSILVSAQKTNNFVQSIQTLDKAAQVAKAAQFVGGLVQAASGISSLSEAQIASLQGDFTGATITAQDLVNSMNAFFMREDLGAKFVATNDAGKVTIGAPIVTTASEQAAIAQDVTQAEVAAPLANAANSTGTPSATGKQWLDSFTDTGKTIPAGKLDASTVYTRADIDTALTGVAGIDAKAIDAAQA